MRWKFPLEDCDTDAVVAAMQNDKQHHNLYICQEKKKKTLGLRCSEREMTGLDHRSMADLRNIHMAWPVMLCY